MRISTGLFLRRIRAVLRLLRIWRNEIRIALLRSGLCLLRLFLRVFILMPIINKTRSVQFGVSAFTYFFITLPVMRRAALRAGKISSPLLKATPQTGHFWFS